MRSVRSLSDGGNTRISARRDDDQRAAPRDACPGCRWHSPAADCHVTPKPIMPSASPFTLTGISSSVEAIVARLEREGSASNGASSFVIAREACSYTGRCLENVPPVPAAQLGEEILELEERVETQLT